MAQAPQEVSVSALPPDQVAAVGKLFSVCPPTYSSSPPGRFLRGKHGITHFHVQEPEGGSPSARSRIAVLSHGLGTDMSLWYGPVLDTLCKSGFRVLRYDFFGHGWSYSNETFLRYDRDIFCSQIEELLDHVLAPGEPVDLWVGHSTGCIVGVLNAMSEAHPIRALAMISPAFWANKPLVARIADKIPNFMHGLVKSIPLLKKLPQDAYLENNDIAFAKQGSAYMFPEAYNVAKENIKEKFKLHPQVAAAILGVASFFLRDDLITEFRTPFKDVVKMEGSAAPAVHLLWGKYDVVVPFKHAQEVLDWGKPGRVSLAALDAGHEALNEVPEVVAKELAKLAPLPSRM